MHFTFKGFDQQGPQRRFLFDGVAPDRSHKEVEVFADVKLLREYGIPIQTLPLLCQQRLDKCDSSEIAAGKIIISQVDMAALRTAAREVAEQKARSRQSSFRPHRKSAPPSAPNEPL